MENIAVYRNGEFLREFEQQEYFLLKRDIAGFYEEQSNWATLYGDVEFGTALKLPYWEYLDVRHVNESDAEFFRIGCLLILASMALEPYEELGTYYLSDDEKAKVFMDTITSFETNNKDEQRLINLIVELRKSFNPENLKNTIRPLDKELQWVHVNYIYGYFRNKTKAFGEHLEVLYLKEKER
ncbi:MAG: hypothetical protein OCD76_20940 [Reichenbachiella sp.]